MELKINSGFGKFPVKDPIRKIEPEVEREPEEETKFPMPFGKFSIGLAIGIILGLTFAHYWQEKHYGELTRAFERIQLDTGAMEKNNEAIKSLVSKNEAIANRVDSDVSKITQKVEELKSKRSKIVTSNP